MFIVLRLCLYRKWTSLTFVDTSLSPVRHGFKRHWTDPAQVAVSTGAIIEHFDVLVDLGIGHLTSLVDSLLNPFLLQAAKERFGHCVIPAVSTSAHTGLKMMRMAEAPPRIAAKLRSLIRMNQCVRWLASPHGHKECIQHEFSSHRGFC